MLHLSKTSNTTIIITTHYIEEARKADMVHSIKGFIFFKPYLINAFIYLINKKVGLIRNGKILAEHPPDYLLQIHNEIV